jgi:hypothetical protein
LTEIEPPASEIALWQKRQDGPHNEQEARQYRGHEQGTGRRGMMVLTGVAEKEEKEARQMEGVEEVVTKMVVIKIQVSSQVADMVAIAMAMDAVVTVASKTSSHTGSGYQGGG